MSARQYRLRVFQAAPGADVYGAKHYIGTLDRVCAIAERMFEPDTLCRSIAPGHYRIGLDRQAEIEVIG